MMRSDFLRQSELYFPYYQQEVFIIRSLDFWRKPISFTNFGVVGLIERIKCSKTYFFDFVTWTSCVSSNTTHYSYIYVQNYHEPWSIT